MALADLMKKGFLTSATATVATPATHGRTKPPTVATVAGVAVAELPKVKNADSPASEKLSLADTLALFRFDLVQAEIAAGHSESELRRVNNMAYVFMRDDHMTLGDAMKLAGEIVVKCPMVECELTYPDVMKMWSEDCSRLP